jgi:hypothetical protein
LEPTHVSSKKVLRKVQKRIFFVGENFVLFFFIVVNLIRIKIEERRAMTPPNLDGMARRIAYANRKYHSGWMCTGARSGLAGEKFSASISILGLLLISALNIVVIIKVGTMSFIVKFGWNLILSKGGFVLFGLEDPFSCNRRRCSMAVATITSGRIKCREKNRFNVG